MVFSKKEDKYHGIIIFHIILWFVYGCTILLFYQYYSAQLENRKNEVLNNYYQIVLYNSVIRLERVVHKFPLNQRDNVVINIDDTNILTCYESQCIKSDLFEVASLIDQFMPPYINYKIEVNKQLLHHNKEIQSYNFEKSHYINKHNQIIFSLSLGSEYLNWLYKQTYMPFGIMVIFLTFLVVAVMLVVRFITNNNKKYYSSCYQDSFDSEMKKMEENFSRLILEKENTLMKKIWSLEYKEEKDIELNHLFSQEANKLAIITQKVDYINSIDELEDNIVPCSLILYSLNPHQEKINIKSLIETFYDRFGKSEKIASFVITSDVQSIYFASKASLYQVIYSIFTYILYVLEEQSCKSKYNIKLDIIGKEDFLSLIFEFDDLVIKNENALSKYSTQFFRKHPNPFLLSIDQIFYVLRSDKYDCSADCNKKTIIKISKQYISKTFDHQETTKIIKLHK